MDPVVYNARTKIILLNEGLISGESVANIKVPPKVDMDNVGQEFEGIALRGKLNLVAREGSS